MFFFNSKKRGQDTSNALQSSAQSVHAAQEPALDPSTPAAALLQSPYYGRYRSVFDQILRAGDQPKYKIDWLLQSLEMGHELDIDGFYVAESIKKDLPYYCETEHEFDMFFKSDKPVLRGSVQGILEMFSFYLYLEKNPSKLEYWKRRLLEMAKNGNHEAQAALCTNFVNNAFSESDMAAFKETYEMGLMQLAEAGNSAAQLAVGEFLLVQKLPQRISWLMKAAQQGLSDAWYHLGMTYESAINIDDTGRFNPNYLSDDEKHQLMVKKAECFLNGAKANNGIMAAWCQYKVGDYYAEGDFLPKNLTQAAYWYQEALKNGEEMAKGPLEYVGKLLSEQ